MWSSQILEIFNAVSFTSKNTMGSHMQTVPTWIRLPVILRDPSKNKQHALQSVTLLLGVDRWWEERQQSVFTFQSLKEVISQRHSSLIISLVSTHSRADTRCLLPAQQTLSWKQIPVCICMKSVHNTWITWICSCSHSYLKFYCHQKLWASDVVAYLCMFPDVKSILHGWCQNSVLIDCRPVS